MPANNKFHGPLRASVVGGLLLCAALSSPALTMDRLRGMAWLGQPLDVNAQVRLDAADDAAALCFEAEVFHGDQRQDASRVRVNATPGQGGLQVRVQSMVPVDEPVVTVYLRETCVSKSTRRYVLLSEIPPAVALSPAVPVAVSALAAPATPVPTAPDASGASVPTKVTSTKATPAPVAVRPKPAVPRAPKAVKPAKPVAPAVQPSAPQPALQPAPQAAVPAKPQLKLDPVDSLSERVALLETQRQDESGSAEQEAQRLKKLEDSVQNLLKVASRNERTIAELRERLQQAEAEKYDNPVVYGLIALLLTGLGAGVYLRRRQRGASAEMPERAAADSGTPWWSRASRTPDDGPALVAEATTVAAAVAVAPQLVPTPDEAGAEVNLDDLLASTHAQKTEAPPEPVPEEPVLPEISELPELLPELPEVASAFAEPVPTPVLAPLPELHAEPESAEVAAIPAFPVPQVDIDVSHLSLSPVEETALPSLSLPSLSEASLVPESPVAAAPAGANPAPTATVASDAEPMLDFDFTQGGDDEASKPGGGKSA